MHEQHPQIDNKTLQGADEPFKLLGIAWYYGGYVALAIALHWFILRPLIGIYCILTGISLYFLLLLLSVSRDEPRMKNLMGYARRAATWRRVAGRWAWTGAAAPVATVDDEVVSTRQGLRMALEVDLTSLDSYDQEGRAHLCGDLARLVRTRTKGQWIELLIKSVAIDGAAVMDDIRAMLAPAEDMFTPELAAMAERDIADLDRQMRTRFVGTLRGYIVVGPPPSLADEEGGTGGEVETLRHTTETVETELAGMGLGSRRLDGDALRAIVAVPTVETEGLLSVKTDRGYAATIAVLLPDDQTNPGYLVSLIASLSCPFDLAIHVEGLDRAKEKKRFKLRRRFEKEDDDGNAGAGVEIARSRRTGVVRWGLYLTVWAEDEKTLRRQVIRAREKLTVDMNAEIARLRGHQAPGLYATRAHGVDYADRRWRIDTNTVGNCFPFLRFNPGTEAGPPIAFAGNQLVRLNLQDRDHRNALANVIGLSGSGKTVLGLLLLKWKLYQRGRGTVLERTGDPSKGIPSHYAALCTAAGGEMVYIGGAQTATINIWERSIPDIIGAHEIILGEPGTPFSKLWRSLVSQGVRAVKTVYAAPLEEDFWRWLRAESDTPARSEKERDILREMAATLEDYVGDGEHSHIFNRTSSVAWESHLLVFNSQATPDHLQPLLIFLVNAAIADRGMREGEVPPLTILDEGWKVAEFEAGAKAIQEHGKRGRQTAAELLFLTQAVRDMKKSGVVDLFDNAAVTILMRLVDNTGSAVDDMAVSFGLTAREKDIVQGLKTVRDERLFNGKAQAFVIRQLRSQSHSVRHAVDVPTNRDEGLMFLSDPLHMVWLRERLIQEHGGVLAGIVAMREILARGEAPAAVEGNEDPAAVEDEISTAAATDTREEELEEAV